mmetsp:Transcript_78001/g.126513  ORF Transcript_78001/g.126513 Transcript_78001/m.126513 type:complete len:87 (+) Transcript_78001:440-700(+)
MCNSESPQHEWTLHKYQYLLQKRALKKGINIEAFVACWIKNKKIIRMFWTSRVLQYIPFPCVCAHVYVQVCVRERACVSLLAFADP